MKKKNLGIIMLLALLFVGIGFAAITTNLSIDGTAKINGNSSNFTSNIQFETASAGTGATATISTDKKSVTFTTQDLKAINDSSVLTYTIKNASNYGATLGPVTCTSTDSDYATYVTVTPSRTTNLNVAKGATTAAETITVKMIKTYPETTAKSIAFTCTINATATAA